MSEPARRRATWDDLLEVPEGYIGEIVDGQLQMHPRPSGPHAETTSDLGGVLTPPFRFGRGGPGGWVILDEPRVDFIGDIRVPDLAGWRVERYQRPRQGPYVVIPDWVCEVLSPSTAIEDRTEKLPLYQRAEVRYLWLIDPLGFSLEAYELQAQGYLLILTKRGQTTVRVPPFDAIEIDLALLWGDRFEDAPRNGEPE